MLYTIFASLPFLGIILFCGGLRGSFFIISNCWEISLAFGWCRIFFFIISVGIFFVKLPVFFFHLWLPKAHVEAPVSGSIILAGVLLKLGGYGVYRVCQIVGFVGYSYYYYFIVVILWGGVITSFICLLQSDLKSLVAYSSIGHIAMMVSGILTGFRWGAYGGLLIMVGHGLCSSFLFVLARVSYDFLSSRSVVLVKGFLCIFPGVSLL